ncbi:caspase family protein [Streptomyces sp. NPDC050504]|uniref:caspase family protein n=1 Tax=Streptomyces sp. NPDC050504 TaxID=3365618 RepID=UPI003794FA86
MTAPEAVRRVLVVSGTARYDHEDELPELPGVDADLSTVADVFGRIGYAASHRLLDPTAEQLRRGLAHWASLEDRTDDVVAVYVSGHGDRDAKGHFLMCRDSVPGQLRSSAVESERVVEILVENGFSRILLLIDTCYAGQGAVDALRSLADDLISRRSLDEQRLDAFSVIAATRPQELAADGAFAAALREAVDGLLLGGNQQPKLYLEAIVDRVNQLLDRRGTRQRATLAMLAGDGFPFVPNPRYDPDLHPGELDLAEQRTWISAPARAARARRDPRQQRELDSHFGPRGRGSDALPGRASYFTGRTSAIGELAAWLDGDPAGPGSAVLVTGGGGVGKSALLGRLVLLADPALRTALDDIDPAVRLPLCPVDAHVHARHLRLDEIVAAVADAAGHPGADVPRLLAALRERTEPFSLVVDALDEAGAVGGAEEPRLVATTFLRELARVPRVRLLVGARRSVDAALGPDFTRIDLDDPRWLGPDDIRRYALKLLHAPDGEGSTGLYGPDAEALARHVADWAGDNFLAARLVARELGRDRGRGTPSPLPGESGTRTPVADAFRWALRQRLGARTDFGRALLTPLAFAEGAGLPSGGVWQAMATAVLEHDVRPEDLEWLLAEAGAHIVESTVDNRAGEPVSVYRLYHESLTAELRAEADEGLPERLARALVATVPLDPGTGVRDWAAADPYVHAHVATHAAAAGLLAELLGDPHFLLHAEPAALSAALAEGGPFDEDVAATAAAWQRCAPDLRPEIPLPERAARLRLAAFPAGADELARRLGEAVPALPWDVRWADVRPTDPYRALGTFDRAVKHVAVLHREERTLIATAEEGNRVLLWDFDTGHLVREITGLPEGRVCGLAACPVSDPPRLLVRSGHGARRGGVEHLTLWDVTTGTPQGPGFTTEAVHAALTEAGGTPVAVVLAPDATVEVVDLRSGEVRAELTDLAGTPGKVQALDCCVDDGMLVVVAAVGHDRQDRQRAAVARWTLDPRHGWSAVRFGTSRLTDPSVCALRATAGATDAVTVGDSRPPGVQEAAPPDGRPLFEWRLDVLEDPAGFATAEGGAPVLVLTDRRGLVAHWGGDAPHRVDVAAREEGTGRLALARAHDGLAELVSATTGGEPLAAWTVRLDGRDRPARREPGTGMASSGDLAMTAGRVAGHEVLVIKKPLQVYPDTYTVGTGRKRTHRGVYGKLVEGRVDQPLLVFDWEYIPFTQSLRKGSIRRIEEGGRAREVKLRRYPLDSLTVLARAGTHEGAPLVAALSERAAHVWHAETGAKVGGWRMPFCYAHERVLHVVQDGPHPLLGVGQYSRHTFRVFRLPDGKERRTLRLPHHQRDRYWYDFRPVCALGTWPDGPVAGYESADGQIAVHWIDEPDRTLTWHTPGGQHVAWLWLMTSGRRPALLALLHDHSLVLAAMDDLNAEPYRIPLRSPVLGVVPVGEDTVGIRTAAGVLCLRIPVLGPAGQHPLSPGPAARW